MTFVTGSIREQRDDLRKLLPLVEFEKLDAATYNVSFGTGDDMFYEWADRENLKYRYIGEPHNEEPDAN